MIQWDDDGEAFALHSEMVKDFFDDLKSAKESDRARAVIAFVLTQITDGRAPELPRATVIDIICAALEYAQSSMANSIFTKLLECVPQTPPPTEEARQRLFANIGQQTMRGGLQFSKENQKARAVFRNLVEILQAASAKAADKEDSNER